MRKTFRLIRIFGMAGFAGLLATSPLLPSNARAQEYEFNAFGPDRYPTPYRDFDDRFRRYDRHYPTPGDTASFLPPQVVVQLPASTWYYCESAKSYYPYVSECKEGWLSVPAIPPQTN
jgi:hypothetical protein